VTLVLASSSPQRRAILERLGIAFVLRPSDVQELEQGDPPTTALANALAKASAIAPSPGEVVLGIDTIVALDGVIYGKPQNAEQAAATLRALSGRTHSVISGLALVRVDAEPKTLIETTAVSFRTLDERTIAWHVATGEWQGRSGGYAIQQAGSALARRIDGDYTNVVGLPVGALLDVWPGLLEQPPAALR
jgi:septum formation protein